MKKISFPARGEFNKTLKNRVDQYFSAHNLVKTGNWRMFLKTILVLAWLVVSYLLLVFFSASLETGILVKLHEGQPHGVDKSAQGRQEQVDGMPGQQKDQEEQPAHVWDIQQLKRYIVEYKPQYGRGNSQGKQPDVGKQVTENTRDHPIGIPYAGSELREDVFAGVIEEENQDSGYPQQSVKEIPAAVLTQ